MKHALERTSPKGPGRPFFGRCINCGKEGLTIQDFNREDCENPVGRNQDETLLAAIEGPKKLKMKEPSERGDGEVSNPRYLRKGLPFAIGRAVEELGELQAALGKTLRWGWESCNPELPKDLQESNRLWVLREMKDVRDALKNLESEMEILKQDKADQ